MIYSLYITTSLGIKISHYVLRHDWRKIFPLGVRFGRAARPTGASALFHLFRLFFILAPDSSYRRTRETGARLENMSTYKLTYFPIRARAELARFVFAQAGVKYEDVRIPQEKWPELKPCELALQG